MLLVVALVEVAVNRIAVPLLRPDAGDPPLWHTALDYCGLFLFYFTGALAAMVIVARAVSAIEANRGIRDLVSHVLLGLAALVAAIPLLIDVPSWTNFVLEAGFGIALIAITANVFAATRDVGVQVGLPIIVTPLLFHTITALVAAVKYPEDSFNAPGGPGAMFAKIGVLCLALAALTTPYCFSPRPFSRAVTKPIPIVVAMALAAAGAVLTRLWYPALAKTTELAIGVVIAPKDPDPRQALYLLALATIAWTLSSCAFASSPARRTIGAGLGLILIGGYGLPWPQHYLLPLLGVAMIAEAARSVRDEELEAMPIVVHTPPVPDVTWSTFVGVIAQNLRRVLADVHSVTTRGEGGLTSSVIVGDAKGIPVRTRIERIDGRVLAFDVVVGREVDEMRGSSVTVWAMPALGTGANPAGPPATPIFKTDDAAFDDRFRARGNATAFAKLFDADSRARAVATLDGWLAYWEGEGVRYRVYPGRGSPLDHPLPLSDLAQGRVPPTSERLIAVISLLVEAGARVLEAAPATPEPSSLDDVSAGGDA
ncbi:MAG: hypothetical protein ABI867_31250, partial [Kofleriaceae bacterium]